MIESFLLKLKTITTCFEHGIFHNKLMESLFLEILQVATGIRVHHRLFRGDNLIFKNFKKLSLVESLFNYNTGL